jgi:hypothetical protein
MNEQNYASFEASKKLFDAGIILETEFYWVEREDWDHINLDGSSKNIITIDKKDDCDEFAIPAPSFGDLLKELLAGMSRHKIDGHYSGYMLEYTPSYLRNGNVQFQTYKKNPIYAIVEFFIWFKKEEIKRIKKERMVI